MVQGTLYYDLINLYLTPEHVQKIKKFQLYQKSIFTNTTIVYSLNITVV